MIANQLTKEDVLKLAEDSSVDRRIETVGKLSSFYDGQDLSAEEIKLAEDIFKVMVKDAEVIVRKALSENLKENNNIPRDLAISLAADVESVSLPFIEVSEILTTEDLVSIVNSENEQKQKAVAKRKNLQPEVSHVIVEQCGEEVVETLIENHTAKISEKTYSKVIERYGENEKIKERMVYRTELPINIVEELVAKVSEKLQSRLITHHNLPMDMATDLVIQIRERATLSLSDESGSDDKIRELVLELQDKHRLTKSIIIRAICMGDLKFFEHSLSALTNKDIKEVRKTLHKNIPHEIHKILGAAGFDKSSYSAISNAIIVIQEMSFDGGMNDKARFSQKIIERLLTYNVVEGKLESDDLEYLISKIK